MSHKSLEEAVYACLTQVQDPELHRDLVALDRVHQVQTGGGDVRVTLKLDGVHADVREVLMAQVRDAVQALPGVGSVEVKRHVSLDLAGGHGNPARAQKEAEAQKPPQQRAREDNPLPQVRHIIAVGAGKGGVGKSTVSVTLAVALARKGFKVGLLDGDIYGPSVPTMMGLGGQQPRAEGQTIIPFEVHGIRTMSVGSLVDADNALVWRGPMAHGAFKQLALQTRWGVLDYLIIDLPPGTGDVPLSLAQMLPLSGSVVVCTPQKVAQDDARRAVTMFKKFDVEVLGLVENMSHFVGDDGKVYDLFGRGGVQVLAEQLGLPCLGQVPITPLLRQCLDAGDPSALFAQDAALAEALEALASSVEHQVRMVDMEG